MTARVEFYDVFVKPRLGHMDYESIAYVNRSDEIHATMKWYYGRDDGEEFMFLDLMFIKEAGVILITDFYGYNKHSWGDWVEYHMGMKNDNILKTIIRDIKDVLKTMYDEYTIMVYNKGYFKKIQTNYKLRAFNEIVPLLQSPNIPVEIVHSIYKMNMPNWLSYKHQKTTKNSYNTHRKNYNTHTRESMFYDYLPEIYEKQHEMTYSVKPVYFDVFTLSKVVIA